MGQEFPSISDQGAVTLAVALAAIASFGGLTNALVVVTHIKFRKKMLKESKDILVFSLAVGDLTMSALVCPFGFSSAVAGTWTTGKVGCVWYGFVTTCIGLSSMLQLAVISVERYYTLSHPNAKPVKRQCIAEIIILSWVIAFAASCLPLFGWSEYTFEGFGLHCSIAWSSERKKYAWYCCSLLVLFFTIPVTAIGISYGKMYLVVRGIFRYARTMWGTNTQVTRRSYMAQVKITKQLFIVTSCFLLAWTPYAVISMLRAFTTLKFAVGVYELPALFTKISNIYNPIVYFFMYKRLRKKAFQTLNDIFKKLRSWFTYTWVILLLNIPNIYIILCSICSYVIRDVIRFLLRHFWKVLFNMFKFQLAIIKSRKFLLFLFIISYIIHNIS